MLEFGCTATVAVLQGRRVCLANVGDSQAVLGSCNEQVRGSDRQPDKQAVWAHETRALRRGRTAPVAPREGGLSDACDVARWLLKLE